MLKATMRNSVQWFTAFFLSGMIMGVYFYFSAFYPLMFMGVAAGLISLIMFGFLTVSIHHLIY